MERIDRRLLLCENNLSPNGFPCSFYTEKGQCPALEFILKEKSELLRKGNNKTVMYVKLNEALILAAKKCPDEGFGI